VLDGRFDKWLAERRPVDRGPAKGYPQTVFAAKSRPGRFIGKDKVLAATKDPEFVIVNALGPQFHQGLEPRRYGRPGRIPGSVNVPICGCSGSLSCHRARALRRVPYSA
jgi:thiosulfate/3-mercaptopyruvate sulfurtransferase